jgi:2,3,4,5-tetrahydropyridine-2-carboxylate N-succinyltransferase
MTVQPLQRAIEYYFSHPETATDFTIQAKALEAFLELRAALERGELRSAEPEASAPTGWRVNAWVKQGILLGFRLGVLVELPGDTLSLVDKNTYPLRRFTAEEGCGSWLAAQACGLERM